MEKLKVLHVYKSFNVYNGLIEILTILAQNLDYERYELGVCVYEYKDNSFGEKFQSLGGKIFNLKVPPRFYNEPRELWALYDFFKSYQPHVVQTHVLKANLYGTIAAKMAHVPVVVATEMTLKDIAPSPLRRLRDHLVQPFAGYVIDNCDRFMVTSNFIRQEWLKSGRRQSFEVIYPPFNLEKYDEAVRKPRAVTSSLGKRVGFVGRLSEEKSVNTLIDAMSVIVKKMPDADLTIVGTGPLENNLKEHCSRLGIDHRVDFAGYRSNSFDALKEMDIFVLPSRTEGCPIVILEAMAMGLPVVATNVGGNPELVTDNETGILVPWGDSEAMAPNNTRSYEQCRKSAPDGTKRKETGFFPVSSIILYK